MNVDFLLGLLRIDPWKAIRWALVQALGKANGLRWFAILQASGDPATSPTSRAQALTAAEAALGIPKP